MDELKRQGIGDLMHYAQVYNRYKPLIDRAKEEYDANPELQKKVKLEFKRLRTMAETEFKDSPSLMQLFITMPNILKELKER